MANRWPKYVPLDAEQLAAIKEYFETFDVPKVLHQSFKNTFRSKGWSAREIRNFTEEKLRDAEIRKNYKSPKERIRMVQQTQKLFADFIHALEEEIKATKDTSNALGYKEAIEALINKYESK